MANDHVLELPKFVWILKIVQLVLSVLVLGLAAFNVTVVAFNAHALTLFTALFSMIVLVYYFVAVHGPTKLYNWIAILALECLAWIFWLSSWAVLAALYATPVSYYYGGYDYDYYYKRSLEKRLTWDDLNNYTGTFISALTFSVLNFVLFSVTLAFIALGAHRHRKQGRPIVYGGTGHSNTADVEQLATSVPETTQVPSNQPVQTHSAPVQQQYTGV